MKYLTSSFRQISRLFVLLLAIYFLIRILFFFFNYAIFQDMEGSDIFSALFFGMRYDISAILYTNFPFFLLLLIPFRFKQNSGYRKTIQILFLLVNIAAFSIAFSDFAYFQFNLKRIDVEILGLVGAMAPLMWDFIMDFYPVFILFFALVGTFIKITKKLFVNHDEEKFRFGMELSTFIIILPILVIGMRGGLSNKRPIRIVDSSSYVPVKYSPLVTNSVFTFITSIEGRILDKKTFFGELELVGIYDVQKSSDGIQSADKPNVVVLILESFSKEFIGKLSGARTYTPFLDELIDSGLICTNAYANGRRSSQGLVAITASIPALMDEPFMYSKYINNKIYGLGSILQDHGYETFFFNGSAKYNLGWESYLMASGFEHNLGLDDYPNKEHSDGSWGIYDHNFYDFFLDEMSKAPRPFGSIFFTLSSHHPYKVPPEFQDRFTNNSEFLSSLEYADYALKLFFEKARETDWYENTVFVISADHTYGAHWNDGDSETNRFKTRKGLYEIPILFYSPGNPELIGRVDFPVQQTDIMPSLIDYLNLKSEFISFGQSIFSRADLPRIACQYLNGIYQIVDEEYILMHDGDKAIALYNAHRDALLENNILESEPEIVQRLERLLKAVIQQHNNRLIENDLTSLK